MFSNWARALNSTTQTIAKRTNQSAAAAFTLIGGDQLHTLKSVSLTNRIAFPRSLIGFSPDFCSSWTASLANRIVSLSAS
jgi:hypothetical protein